MATAALAAVSQAQFGAGGWSFECIDPQNTAPYSTDYNFNLIENELMRISVGASGTVTYGGQNGPCYAPTARTLDAAGRFAFQVGNLGSVQSNFDDDMALTFGAPTDPVGDYVFARILKGDNDGAGSALFGDGGLRVTYIGASRRYIIASWADADVDVECQVRLLGDAARIRWRMTNLAAEGQSYGLLFSCYPGMRTGNGVFDSESGANQAHSGRRGLTSNPKQTPEGYIGVSDLPGQRPIRTERRHDIRSLRFPAYMQFLFGQTNNYGLRVDNIPPAETPDATGADLIKVGNHTTTSFGNNINLRVFGDNNPVPAEEADVFIGETTFVQRFPVAQVGPGQQRTIVHYVRSSWSVSDYADPYTVVVDAPKFLATDPNDPQSFAQNPFTVRVYIDNQFADVDKEVPLNNAQVRLFLPDGMNFPTGQTGTRTIGSIAANGIGFVDFQVEVDENLAGPQKLRVNVIAPPGAEKNLEATVVVAPTPRLPLPVGPSLVTLPYTFEDSSFDTILGLQAGVDFQAFRFDPLSNTFRPAESAERGRAYWVLPTSDLGNYVLPNAIPPTDAGQGGLSITLQQGWNLIGNPYPYPVPAAQVNAVYADSPETVFSLNQLVSQGVVSSSLIFWDRSDGGTGQYKFESSSNGTFVPHVGYWVFSNGFRPVRLIFPPVFQEGLPNSGRSVDDGFVQSDRNWRLELAVRSNKGIDSQNFIGQVRDAQQAKVLTTPEPPMAPSAVAALSIKNPEDNNLDLSRSFSARVGREEWKVSVNATEAGEYTVTWPNLPSVTRAVRFRIKDEVTGESRDLRASSGYTFRVSEPGTRLFTISAEPGGASRPVIGNVVVSRPTRDVNAPVTVQYALSADALVTVRILSSTGREVFTVSRGRSEGAGENSVTWNLQDNANRAVAPGVYRVEILAETPSGERVRRIVPVNVVR